MDYRSPPYRTQEEFVHYKSGLQFVTGLGRSTPEHLDL
jgi:hypothetical protein